MADPVPVAAVATFATLEGAGPSEPEASLLQSLVKPDPSLSYSFIAGVYAVLCAISALLLIVQYFGLWAPANGFWIIPAPALPALAWVLWLGSRQGKSEGGKSKTS